MIQVNGLLFDSDDQMITLTDGKHKIYIRKRLLMQKTLYFKHMFSDISSDKDVTEFTFDVPIVSMINYVMYLETGIMKMSMLDDEGFMSLANTLGTIGINNDIYINKHETLLKSMMVSNEYNY